jgi:23S rRNA pseudouridine1911/1915/1917 synthase
MSENLNNDNQELYEHYRFVVDSGQKPLRIDKFLVNKMEFSRNKIQNAADAGNILVNDKPVKSNYKVKPGDVVSIVMAYPPREIELIPEDIPVNIVYEDDELIVVNKEAGMVVHPAYGHYSGTLVNALLHHLKDLPGAESGEVRPGLVHRIDKNTSGLLIVAKTEFSMNHLAKQFYDKTTHREYIALAWGSLKEKKGTIEGHIGRSLKNRKVMQVFPAEERGKPAITHYEVMEDLGYVTLLKCWLETGRTHQIRIHMKHIGHPLFNDEEYGGDKILKGTLFTKYKQFVNNCFSILPRQALHAKTLGFKHPRTGEKMFFDSELPEDMKQAIDKWRHYTSYRGKE